MIPVNRVAFLLGFDKEADMARKRATDHVPDGKTQLGTYISRELHESLLDFSDASGVPITRIAEDALRSYLERNYWKVGTDE